MELNGGIPGERQVLLSEVRSLEAQMARGVTSDGYLPRGIGLPDAVSGSIAHHGAGHGRAAAIADCESQGRLRAGRGGRKGERARDHFRPEISHRFRQETGSAGPAAILSRSAPV